MAKGLKTIIIILFMTPTLLLSKERTAVFLGNSIFGGIQYERIESDYKIIVQSIPDFTSYQQTWVFEQFIFNHNPQLAILNGGQEDFLLEIPPEKVVENYLFAAQKLREENITPVLTSCLYMAGQPTLNQNITEFNRLLKEACQANEIQFLDLNQWFADGETLYGDFTHDGYNLNAEGYHILHKVLSTYLRNETLPDLPIINPGSNPKPFAYDLKQHAMQRIKRILSESPEDVSLCMLGNSITEQGGNWNERLGQAGIRNSGQGGYTTGQMMWHIDTTVLDAQPKTCFVMGGINDLSIGVPEDVVVSNLKKNIQLLKDKGIQPVLQSTFYQRNSPENQPKITRINTEMERWCLENDIVFLDVNSVLSENQNLKEEYTTDGTHLTEKGYEVWAEFLKREFF